MQQALENFAVAIGGIAVVVGGILVLVPLGTLFGAIAGWIVGWFFGETVLHVLAQMGLRDITMWQFGATLGFAGGFLKTKVSHGTDKK